MGTIQRAGRVAVAAAFAILIAAGPAQASHLSSGHPVAANLAKKSCTRGYSPCIPNKAGDVDCYGGSGNGPRYTKPGVIYNVTGADIYGLDADHDHLGCEPYRR